MIAIHFRLQLGSQWHVRHQIALRDMCLGPEGNSVRAALLETQALESEQRVSQLWRQTQWLEISYSHRGGTRTDGKGQPRERAKAHSHFFKTGSLCNYWNVSVHFSKFIQLCMYLEYTGTPNLIVLHIHHISHKLKVWGNTVSRKFITTIFLTAPAHFMSVSHFKKYLFGWFGS